MQGGECWGRSLQRGEKHYLDAPPYIPHLCSQPQEQPFSGEWQCTTLCPTWSAAGLFSPLAPCRSPASSESLSDLTSTTILSLRASGFVLGEGGDNFETCLRYQRGHVAG